MLCDLNKFTINEDCLPSDILRDGSPYDRMIKRALGLDGFGSSFTFNITLMLAQMTQPTLVKRKLKQNTGKINSLFNLPMFGLSTLVTGNVSLVLLARALSLTLVFSSAKMLSIENDPWNCLAAAGLCKPWTTPECGLKASKGVGIIRMFLCISCIPNSLTSFRGEICPAKMLWPNSFLSSFLLGFLLRLLLNVPSAKR